MLAQAQGLVIVHQHKTEHHLNSKQKGMKIPIDGRLIQQLDVIAGGDSAERSHGLAVQSPYVLVDGIIVIVVQNGSGQGKSPVLELLIRYVVENGVQPAARAAGS